MSGSIVVFWREEGLPKNQDFDGKEMLKALAACEQLRKLRREGSSISHVCISSELDDNTGPMGVSDDRPADYEWTKRRGDRGAVTRNPSGA